MPRLGPGSAAPEGNRVQVPAGRWIVAMKSFKRKVGKTSFKDFLSCCFVVCHGPFAGSTFWATMSCSLDKDGSVKRWLVLMECCGVTEEFELGDTSEGTADLGDRNLRRLFLNKPFVVDLKVIQNGEYTNYDLEKIHFRSKWTDEDKEIIFDWLTDAKSGRDPSENAPIPQDEYDGQPTRFSDADYDSDEPPPPPLDDDDIPF